MTEFDQHSIESRLPHRFENQLLDKVVIDTEAEIEQGSCELTISNGDSRHRDIFMRELPDGSFALFNPVLMEILALGAIGIFGTPKGKVFIFAGINKYEITDRYIAGKLLIGNVNKNSDKRNILLCDGYLADGSGSEIGSAQILAALVDDTTLVPGAPIEGFISPKSDEFEDLDLSQSFKASHMLMIDALCQFDSESGYCVSTYTYPVDHPLVKGHFPGNSVMMGVMQLMSIEDACFALAKLFLNEGKTLSTVKGDAEIVKSTGNVVAVVKKFEIAIIGHGTPYLQAEMTAFRKTSFKEIVIPGDTLYIHLNNLEISH